MDRCTRHAFRLHYNENKFAILGESDGASANEYLSIANLISRSGDIYMGGTSGLLRIKKDITFDDTTYPTAEIMDIQLDGVSILNKISPNSTLSILGITPLFP